MQYWHVIALWSTVQTCLFIYPEYTTLVLFGVEFKLPVCFILSVWQMVELFWKLLTPYPTMLWVYHCRTFNNNNNGNWNLINPSGEILVNTYVIFSSTLQSHAFLSAFMCDLSKLIHLNIWPTVNIKILIIGILSKRQSKWLIICIPVWWNVFFIYFICNKSETHAWFVTLGV